MTEKDDSRTPAFVVARAETITKLREQLIECRDAIREIGGGGEVAEWTGNDRYRWILGRIRNVLEEYDAMQVRDLDWLAVDGCATRNETGSAAH